jgi:hypothetical protein
MKLLAPEKEVKNTENDSLLLILNCPFGPWCVCVCAIVQDAETFDWKECRVT